MNRGRSLSLRLSAYLFVALLLGSFTYLFLYPFVMYLAGTGGGVHPNEFARLPARTLVIEFSPRSRRLRRH